MLIIEHVDTQSDTYVNRFVELPYRLYATHPLWVPPIRDDVALYLNRQTHPIHQNFEIDFFIAVRDGQDVGRLAVMMPRYGDDYQGERVAQFALFDCKNDLEAATALFERASIWAGGHGLERIFGPTRLTFLEGDGILVEGFEYPQVMYMTPYNYEYYANLIEAAGFEKEVDFLSCQVDIKTQQLPDWLHTVADRVRQSGNLHIQSFATIEELFQNVPQLLAVLQNSLAGNESLGGASQDEVMFAVQHALKIGVAPQLIKTIRHKDEIVGALLAFPNLSTAFQRLQGRFDQAVLQQEIETTPDIVINGFGILPEFQFQGFNALLFSEIEKSVRAAGIQTVTIIQIAETTGRMKNDMTALGIRPTQRHRRYTCNL